jgi:hypothetical protein
MFGVRPATQLLTVQVWQGTEANDLSFDLVFTTHSDPVKDVQKPVYDLMSMVIPSVDTAGFLMSPGPTLDPAKAKELVDTVIAQGKEIASSLGSFASQLGEGVGAAGLSLASNASGKTPDNYKTETLNNTEKQAIPEKGSGVRATGATASALKSQLTAAIKNRISIAFGKLLFIRDIVVVSATPRWNLTSLDAQTGLPNMCTVSVTVRPLFAVTTQDLEEMFQARGNQSATSYNNYEF